LNENRPNRRRCGRRPIGLPGVAVLLIILLGLTVGCAPVAGPPMPGPPDRPTAEPLYWWYARFRMVWEPESKPRWYLGPLIAHRVLRPVIRDFSDRIPLWRFHRRAARDAAGHQFSFIFYATPETAGAVFDRIARDPTLQLLYDGHLLARVVFDDPDDPRRPGVADTSDRHWSAAVQKSWPYFAMGASQTWLNLIDRLCQASPPAPGKPDVARLTDDYRRISGQVDHTWQTEGRHAYLHHLNAIFGYVPLIFRETRYLNF